MNQSLSHNKSSHGRFRGALKSLEKLTALQTLRHIYGTLIEGHEKRSSGYKQPDFCFHSFVHADGNHLHRRHWFSDQQRIHQFGALPLCREPFRQGTPCRCRHKPFEQSLELRTQIQFLTLLL